ncbi:phage/plasmid primase, P4 family [Chloroflexota bacterium]
MNTFETALKLAELGYSVIPSGGGDKHKAPLVNWREWQEKRPSLDQLERWEQELKPSLWGVVTGEVSGVFVADTDTPELREVFTKHGLTLNTKTPRQGGHFFFRYDRPVKTTAGILPGLDIRGGGGFVNVIGSRPDGNYEVINLPTSENLNAWEQLPPELQVAISNNGSKPAGTRQPISPLVEGSRHSDLISDIGRLRKMGHTEVEIELLAQGLNRISANPLPESEVTTMRQEYEHQAPVAKDAQSTTAYNLTDAGNAEYFTSQYSDRLRHDHRRGRWLEWFKHYWRQDTDGQITRLALKAMRDRYKAATVIDDLDHRKEAAKWAIGSESRARLDALTAIARDLKPIADSGEHWDANLWLFSVANGVIELKTGELRPGKQSDMITMQSPVVYDTEAKAPRWQSFLAEIFNDNQELIDWLQRYCGYALTGDTREQVIPIGYGAGANGKTVLEAALRHVFGDYAYDAPFSTFELFNRSPISNDIAALVGKRFVTSSETNADTRLNEARIKALTGGDSVTARFLHCEFFTFQPMAKFFLAVNHRPRTQDDSYGFWRRVRLIPFTRQFKGKADDKELLSKLIAEAPGILNWLIEGCLQWQKVGLEPTPDCILAATREYEADSDPLSQFLLDECAITSQAQGKAIDFYRHYADWCKDQGYREKEILTNNAFGRRMGQKFEKSHERAGAVYHGIGLKCDGFVTDYEPTGKNLPLTPDFNSHVGVYIEKASQSTTTPKNPSHDFSGTGELSDCPVCGKNEWQYSTDGKFLICPCGNKIQGVKGNG